MGGECTWWLNGVTYSFEMCIARATSIGSFDWFIMNFMPSTDQSFIIKHMKFAQYDDQDYLYTLGLGVNTASGFMFC